MAYPEKLRDKMEEQKDQDQATWRIEPYGWDGEDRTYFVLDDNRVYRLSDAPEPPAPIKPVKKRKSYASGRRLSKRRRTIDADEGPDVEDGLEHTESQAAVPEEAADASLGGMKWECVAITLPDVQTLINGFRKTRDGNEKVLRQQLEDHLLPILEKQEESRKRKEIQRERELLNLAKMATAKRSSRLANKAEVKKQEEHEREEEEKQKLDALFRKKQEQEQRKLEKQRDERLFARERRLKERETRRKRHQEELAQLSGDGVLPMDGSMRMSERCLHAEIERNKQALEQLDEEEEDWTFDCVCGLYGQVDDGAHSVACERCNIWQHSQCIGITEMEAEDAAFHFICANCKRRLETPRKTIKIKVRSSAGKDKDDQTPRGSTASPESRRGLVETNPPSTKPLTLLETELASKPTQLTTTVIDIPKVNQPPTSNQPQVVQPTLSNTQPKSQTPTTQTPLGPVIRSVPEATEKEREIAIPVVSAREPSSTVAIDINTGMMPETTQLYTLGKRQPSPSNTPADFLANNQPITLSNTTIPTQKPSTVLPPYVTNAPAPVAPVAPRADNHLPLPMQQLLAPKSSPPSVSSAPSQDAAMPAREPHMAQPPPVIQHTHSNMSPPIPPNPSIESTH
ncbi:hypothetical protein VHEMI06005 [[Torrubiella] hemipterigena]|nr:hypothetical protein VHEMI06005 [[Torrubiella] hemipterigena]